MDATIAVLHTTAVTLPLMKKLLRKELPQYKVINFLDDSILPMLATGEKNLPYVMKKLNAYCGFAQEQKARGILCACSSIGEITEYADASIPVIRVDEAMMEQAAALQCPILLCATVPTTLAPSARLLESKGRGGFEKCLLQEASTILNAEGKEAHDRYIAESILPYLNKGYAVILCQASMADAKAYLPELLHEKILTSPASGTRYFAERMRALYDT